MKKTNKTFKRFAAITSASLLAACAMAPVFTSMTSYAAVQPLDFTLTAPSLPEGAAIQENVSAYELFKISKVANVDGQYNVDNWGTGVNASDLVAALKANTKDFQVQDEDENGDPKVDGEGNPVMVNLFKDVVYPTDSTAEGYAENVIQSAKDVGLIIANFTTEAQKEAFAKAVMNNLDAVTATGTYSKTTENDATTEKVAFTDIQDGYYIMTCNVKGTGNKYTAESLGMLTIVDGTVTSPIIGLTPGTAKVGLPEVIKKVKENSAVTVPDIKINGVDFNADEEAKYNDIADYKIGESVDFKLYGSMPVDIANYDHYYCKFTDTLGTQFTLAETPVFTISVVNNGVAKEVKDNPYNIHINVENNVITIEIEDIKALKDAEENPITIDDKSIITVEYSATLNSTANIGLPGQKNNVDLTYSNNPNVIYNPVTDTKKDDGNGNDTNDKPDDSNVGTTPKDTVIVFTYGAEVNKTFKDAAGNLITPTATELENVTFQIRTDAADADTAIGFTGSNGEYTVGGTVKDLKLLDGSTADTFNIAGLDEGTYYLVETEWIDGFNQAAPIKIVVTADTTNGTEWTDEVPASALTKFTYQIDSQSAVESAFTASSSTDNDCIVPVPVVNSKGTSLPSTGGIGTTIFYLGGGAMAAIGGIYLISKRRMRKSEE